MRVVLKDGKAHFYEKQNGGYVASDGWDLQKIDLGIACVILQLRSKNAVRKPYSQSRILASKCRMAFSTSGLIRSVKMKV